MTVTLDLTAEQEQLLSCAAHARGVEMQALLHEMIDKALVQEATVRLAPRKRIAGLHAGQIHMSEYIRCASAG